MKTIIKTLSVLLIIAATFSGCKKYEDGPKFSLLTKKMRLCHEWKLTGLSFNGADLTVPADYKLDIEKSGTYKVTFAGFSGDGTWKLGEDKDDIYMTSSAANSTEDAFRILRLKSKELWLRSTATNGDKTIFKYGRAD
jgi:hypothetical protein